VGLLAVFAIGPSRWSGWFFVSIAAVYAVGVVSSTWAERLWRRSDPGYVCIDEFAGYLVSIACVPAANEPLLLVAAFFLFRVFDIIKPPPARMAERGPSGWGIMNDDIVAGLYTNLVLQVASRLGWV
jgi:phosphatidylglycerophosphatase A